MGSKYSEQVIDALITKMSPPLARSATSLAREVGIPQSTLSRWLRERGTIGQPGASMMTKRAEDWSAEEKLEALLAYERLNDEQRGALLRSKGLHEAHLQRWKKEFVEGMKLKPFVDGKKDPNRKRIAALEKELRRKEAALAEAAALLVLKKKADALWTETKDGKSLSNGGVNAGS
jgi:transposase-like protein